MTLATLGEAVSATSNDGTRYVVFGICRRCTSSASRLPPAIRRKMHSRAADRVLGDLDRHLCTIAPDAGAARLTLALLGHHQHAQDTIKALGWGDGIDRTEKTP